MKTMETTGEVSSDGMEKCVERHNWRQIITCAREKPRGLEKVLANLWSRRKLQKSSTLVVGKKPYGKSRFMRLFRLWMPLNVIRAVCFIGLCCAMPLHLQAQAWTNTTLSASQRTSLLLAQMTFSEKAAMVYGVAGPT